MRVNPNSEPPELAPTRAARARAQEPSPAADNATLDGAQKLTDALAQIPDVRAEKVAQAKKLVSDPAYPPDATLIKVSDILANHLQPKAPPAESQD